MSEISRFGSIGILKLSRGVARHGFEVAQVCQMTSFGKPKVVQNQRNLIKDDVVFYLEQNMFFGKYFVVFEILATFLDSRTTPDRRASWRSVASNLTNDLTRAPNKPNYFSFFFFFVIRCQGYMATCQ